MDWPPQSLNLNIFKAAWDHPDREQKQRRALIVLQEAWRASPEDFVK